MPPARKSERSLWAVRFMALACVALALMCAALAVAWQRERESAACWRAAAQFQLQPEGECKA
jgi:hypothetical protein